MTIYVTPRERPVVITNRQESTQLSPEQLADLRRRASRATANTTKPKGNAASDILRAITARTQVQERLAALERDDSKIWPLLNPDHRPYFNWLTSELQNVCRDNLKRLDVQIGVLLELSYRRKPRAVTLAREIWARLDQHWPNTNAPGGDGQLGEIHAPDKGVLAALGYRVGKHGLSEDKRHRTLDQAFLGAIPKVESREHMAEWGQPKTSKRLFKLANTLAALARNMKRKRSGGSGTAIADWETDLGYLKRKYYTGRFTFPWPETAER